MRLPRWARSASPQQYPTPWLFLTHKSSPPLGIPCLFPSTLSMPCTRSNTSSDLWLQYYSTTALAPLQPLFHSHSRRPQAHNPRLQYHQLLPLSASMCRQAEPSHSHHNQPQSQTLDAAPPAPALPPPHPAPLPLSPQATMRSNPGCSTSSCCPHQCSCTCTWSRAAATQTRGSAPRGGQLNQ